MATVTYEHAERMYPGGERPAVDDFNLEIADGEFLVLVGPSGCGKSTSLRMLAGLEEVTNGRILIGDRDVTHLPPKERDIAMVFQNYALYPHMTVGDNMAFSLKMAKVGKEERMERVKEAAKLLDLEQYLERKPKALSGGQR
jgi:multiple sugar transport system ATP-binding protein